MSKFKSLEDVTGYLTTVAEFGLRNAEHIKIPDGHMTVISENYNIMFDAIQWITEKIEQPTLNENQQIVLDLLKIWQEKWPSWSVSTVIEYLLEQQNEYHQMLSKQEEAQVIQVFSQWALEKGMNVNEVVKRIAKLQLYGNDLRAQCYNEGLMGAIHIIEGMEQPTLNENQLEVLDGLKFIFVNYNQEFGTNGNIKYALRDFYWYLGTDYSTLENKKLVSMCESYYLLSADEFAQVLGLFSKWALEQES